MPAAGEASSHHGRVVTLHPVEKQADQLQILAQGLSTHLVICSRETVVMTPPAVAIDPGDLVAAIN